MDFRRRYEKNPGPPCVFAAQQGRGAVELFGGVLPHVAEFVLQPHRLVLMHSEGVVGEQFDPLDRLVAAEAFAQRTDVGFGVADARNQHVA